MNFPVNFLGLALVAAILVPCSSGAAELNLATLSCDSYENQIMNSDPSSQKEDALDVVMWLFGFAVAKSGATAMYGDALQQFGNALDRACKNTPAQSLLEALGTVKPVTANPMELTELDCATFEARNTDMMRSDPQSANTIMMWLLGFAVGKSGGHVLDAASVGRFGTALAAQCEKRTGQSLYDALLAVKPSKLRK